MEENKELIIVKQLPIITETLKEIGKGADIKIQKALAMEIKGETPEEIQKSKVEVKNIRTELNNEFKELEAKRKEVKSKVLKPYDEMEEVYKIEVTERYNLADSKLKEKIDAIEVIEKEKITKKVKDYFNEYLVSKKIDFITYENANINVTLSASMKSLLDSAKNYIDRIVSDLELIESDENKVEILVEYKQNGFNVSNATLTVRNRIKAIEEAKKQAEINEQVKIEETKAVEQVTILTRPKEVVKEETYDVTFTVKNATLIKLQALKKFLKDGGYEYEE
jgi:hypothetical protein